MRLLKLGFLVSCLITMQFCLGQEWVGSQFTLDTSIVLQAQGTDIELAKLTYSVNEGLFYYADMKTFQNSSNSSHAVIHTVSMYDYSQRDILLPMPTKKDLKERQLFTFWLNDFHFNGEYAALSTQNHILIYKKIDDMQYVYDTIYDHPYVKATYIYEDNLYYLEEDHDAGFKWFCRPIHGGEEVLIRELLYEAPHVVQAQPNRYLFYTQNYLFFLSTRYPVLHQYTLDGRWIGDIKFDLPCWHPFEDEYIAKTLSVSYGVERIHQTMADIFKYSYPKVVFPFNDTYLLYYTQYDTIIQKAPLQYASYDRRDQSTTMLARKDSSDRVYDGDRFPFNLFAPQVDKAHISWGNLLLEIAVEDTISWRMKSPDEYEKAKERYFKQNEPVYKLRIMHYKNNDWSAEPFFINTQSQLHSLEGLPYGKHALLIKHELECSACENQLLQLMNDSLNSGVNIGILHNYIPGALMERELRKRVKQHLEKPFDFFYLAKNRYEHYPWEQYKKMSYPALLLQETGRAPILLSIDEIFDDDPLSLNFRSSFLEILKKFNVATEVVEP